MGIFSQRVAAYNNNLALASKAKGCRHFLPFGARNAQKKPDFKGKSDFI